jgi:HK97 family phage major capsid protein
MPPRTMDRFRDPLTGAFPALAGGEPTLAELRTTVRDAFGRVERASTAVDALTDESTDEQRSAAQDEFDAAITEHTAATTRLHRAEDLEARREALPTAEDTPPEGGGGGVTRQREPLTYERGNGNSYFLDLARQQHLGDQGAAQRLARHGREMREAAEARNAAAERALGDEVQQWLESLPPQVRRTLEDHLGAQRAEQRALNRTDGTGGFFVPPAWLLDDYAAVPRAGRPFVEGLRQIPLPAGTDSINVPLILTGTAVAPQTADNAAVQSTDLTDGSVNAPVRTIAGQQDIALQLIEQSPIAFDEIVFADLTADYWFKCETQAFSGSGAAGQIKGILNASGIGTTAYTDASPTVPELYPKVAGALSAARTARKMPIDAGWIHPSRYYWVQAAVDSQSRPLVVPQIQGPFNALGALDGTPGGGSGADVSLRMLAPLNVSDGVPNNLGAGTNEDRVVLTRMSDHLWFEGELRARVLPEILSGTLGVRLQVYNYVAATFERFPSATNVVAGTGLVTPTF